jgi:hypothetical protein
MALLPFSSPPTPVATATTPGKVILSQWSTCYNTLGNAETSLVIPQEQNLLVIGRLTFVSTFGRLTVTGRMIGINISTNGTG